MKKIAYQLLILGLGAALSAGCGSSQQNSQSLGDVSVTAQQDEAAVDESTEAMSEIGESSESENSGTEGTSSEEENSASDYNKSDAEWLFPKTGFVLKVPDIIKNLKGQLVVNDYGELDIGSGVYFSVLYYVPRTDEESREAEALIRSYNDDNDPDGSKRIEAQSDYYAKGYAEVIGIIGFKEDMGLDDALKVMGLDRGTFSETGELGQEGDLKYCYLMIDNSAYADEYRETMTEEFYSELETLVENKDAITSNITFKAPQSQEDVITEGDKVSFETKDLDGNTVKSEELFAGHKVSMINIWATWCGPCKSELPELEKMNKELAEKGCQIIGICDDTIEDESNIDTAKGILEECGVSYINLVQTEEMRGAFPIPAYPVTYFVDSEGRLLTQPVVGALFERYGERIEEALAEVE